MSERRVIVIGIDGASPELIESWARGGELPTFSKIVEEGAFGRLRSTTPPLTYPAWSSFMTGKNPGQHGCFDFVYRPPDGYMPRPMNASIRKGASIWRLLGAAGKKVGVFNVPATYPVQG